MRSQPHRHTITAPVHKARALRTLLAVPLTAAIAAVVTPADGRITDLQITKTESPAFGGMSGDHEADRHEPTAWAERACPSSAYGRPPRVWLGLLIHWS